MMKEKFLFTLDKEVKKFPTVGMKGFLPLNPTFR